MLSPMATKARRGAPSTSTEATPMACCQDEPPSAPVRPEYAPERMKLPGNALMALMDSAPVTSNEMATSLRKPTGKEIASDVTSLRAPTLNPEDPLKVSWTG